MAFTDYETEQLRKALLKETRHCAVTLGMKKTSVDQLTKAVGIAKGSFYKFYESKEMLFFAVLENIHSELYGVADHALSEANGLPPSECAAKAVLAVCRRLSDTGDMVFIENDAKLLSLVIGKSQICAPSNMTVLVCSVILYRASYSFARGVRKKLAHQKECSVAERDAGIPVIGNRCCRSKRNYIVKGHQSEAFKCCVLIPILFHIARMD